MLIIASWSTSTTDCGPLPSLRTDLMGKNAQFINPKVFVEKVAAADKVVSYETQDPWRENTA
jgi:hypothetical protein